MSIYSDEKKDNPLLTFIILSYNQEKFIKDAILGAFSQTYQPLEIILSDDCSCDNTAKIIKKMAADYLGPHKIRVNINKINIGIGDHHQKVAKMAAGDLLILSAGDDISQPERVRSIFNIWSNKYNKRTTLLYSDYIPIGLNSKLVNSYSGSQFKGILTKGMAAWGEKIILGATYAVTPDIYKNFPPFEVGVVQEDRILPLRSLLLGGNVIYIDEKLIKYRVEGGISNDIEPTSGRDEFFRIYYSLIKRTLPDAYTRLSDVRHIKPKDRVIEKLCEKKIQSQLIFIDLILGQNLHVELNLIKGIFYRIPIKSLVKTYLKRRFINIYDLWFHARRL